jgi:hypothetical protein
VFAVPGPTFDGATYLDSVDAPAPSEVVGGDLDGDAHTIVDYAYDDR